MWPMFLFGFLGVFLNTQMHGVGLSVRTRWVLVALYVGGATAVYWTRPLAGLSEMVRIPVIEYLVAAVIAALVWVGRVVVRRGRPGAPDADPADEHATST